MFNQVYGMNFYNGLSPEEQYEADRFLNLLQTRFPELTRYNLKQCLYLKKELSIVEMGEKFGVSPNSVKKARQRLRRKLDMSSNTTFSEFFNGLYCQDQMEAVC